MSSRKIFTQTALSLIAFSLTINVFASKESDVHPGHDDHVHDHAEHHDGDHHDHLVEASEFDTEYIIDHVLDAHDWHIFDMPVGDGQYKPVVVPLPVILVDGGLTTFMSSEFEHGHAIVEKGGEHYVLYKGSIYKTDEEGTLTFTYTHDTEKDKEVTDTLQLNYLEAQSEEGQKMISALGASVVNAAPLDMSITKSVMVLFIASLLMFWIFMSAARFYKKGEASSPRGMARVVEPLIIFVRDEIAIPQIGREKYQRFMPYLLTVFFFIWISNLLGLLPLGFNLTGNIAVTFTLAVFTMLITNFNGNKHYWGHIFAPPGVPVALLPIMIPIELIGVFTKPFALMIRLFANITAGHIVIMSLIGVMFKMESIAWSGLSLPLTLFISVIELLVAALQAYIFTILSALFIGGAVSTADH